MTTHDTPEAICDCADYMAPNWMHEPWCSPVPRPTHDTPEAELASALHRIGQTPGAREWCNPWASEVGHQTIHEDQADQILAAMPDWTLVPRVATADWTGSTRKDADAAQAFANGERWGYEERHQDDEAEIARLRAALTKQGEFIHAYHSLHPGTWMACDVPICQMTRAALAPSEP